LKLRERSELQILQINKKWSFAEIYDKGEPDRKNTPDQDFCGAFCEERTKDRKKAKPNPN